MKKDKRDLLRAMSDIDDKEAQLGLLIAIVGIAMGKAL